MIVSLMAVIFKLRSVSRFQSIPECEKDVIQLQYSIILVRIRHFSGVDTYALDKRETGSML